MNHAILKEMLSSVEAAVERKVSPVLQENKRLSSELSEMKKQLSSFKSLGDALINKDHELVLTFSDGSTKSLGVVVGTDGKDAEFDADALIETVKSSVLEAIPTPKDGQDGKDAEFDADALIETVKSSVLEAIPTPKEVDEAALIETVKSSVLEAIPTPKDGQDGKDAEFDADALIETVKSSVLEAIPTPKDGVDGTVDLPALIKEITPALKKQIRKVAKDVSPIEFRDVYQSHEEYLKGDVVLRSGGLWIATKDSPGDITDSHNKGWKLVVKRAPSRKTQEYTPRETSQVKI